MIENWVKCTVTVGQFVGIENGVDGEQHNGTPFSVFVPSDSVKYSEPPTREKPVPGFVKVQVAQQNEDRVLVRLPRETFQGSYFITVKKDQLEFPIKSQNQRKKNRSAR